jgi:hypothetical protein
MVAMVENSAFELREVRYVRLEEETMFLCEMKEQASSSELVVQDIRIKSLGHELRYHDT